MLCVIIMSFVLCPVTWLNTYYMVDSYIYVSSYTYILYYIYILHVHAYLSSYLHNYVLYRSRAYWRTAPRLRSGLRTRPSDGGGGIRDTGMGQERKRRRKKVAVMRVGRRRQGRRRHPRRTRRMIWGLLFTPMISEMEFLKWVVGSFMHSIRTGCWRTGCCHWAGNVAGKQPSFCIHLHMCTLEGA